MNNKTAKQDRFVEEYLVDLNATQAAIRAGYSKKTARSIANELLTKPDIQEAIQKAMQERSERTEVTQDRVLKELAMIAYSDIRNYIEIEKLTGAMRAKAFEEMPEGESRVLKSIKEDRVIKEDADGKKVTVYDKVKFALWDKTKALELIGRHLGMFTDVKVDVGEELKKLIVERIFTDKRPPEG